MIATTKLVLRKSYSRADGSHPIYLRVTINRQSKYFSLGIYCRKENWLSKKEKISSIIEKSGIDNLKLADTTTKANSIINDFTRFSKPPTFIEFTNKFRGNFSKIISTHMHFHTLKSMKTYQMKQSAHIKAS